MLFVWYPDPHLPCQLETWGLAPFHPYTMTYSSSTEKTNMEGPDIFWNWRDPTITGFGNLQIRNTIMRGNLMIPYQVIGGSHSSDRSDIFVNI